MSRNFVKYYSDRVSSKYVRKTARYFYRVLSIPSCWVWGGNRKKQKCKDETAKSIKLCSQLGRCRIIYVALSLQQAVRTCWSSGVRRRIHRRHAQPGQGDSAHQQIQHYTIAQFPTVSAMSRQTNCLSGLAKESVCSTGRLATFGQSRDLKCRIESTERLSCSFCMFSTFA